MDQVSALLALKNQWQNTPSSWTNYDPCGYKWAGINCSTDGRITSITVGNLGLKGQLNGDIQSLEELQTLDLSYNPELTGSLPAAIGNFHNLIFLNLIGCNFFGEIPAEIGRLSNLKYLSLNENRFAGNIPATIGFLLKLEWLDLSNNKLTGTIPVSDDTKPGLDLLIGTKHFHFQNNHLIGPIPSELFSSSMALEHLIFNNNSFDGSIPLTLGLVQSLEILRLDNNSFTGPVPDNLNNLTKLTELHLANNKLTGPLPDLTGMNSLSFVDMSNNSFDLLDKPPSWFSTLPSLTSLYLEYLKIGGDLPPDLFNNSQLPLQTARLKENRFTSVTIGTDYSDQLQLIDLTNNNISTIKHGAYKLQLILIGNPLCTTSSDDYCKTTSNTTTTITTPTPKICNLSISCNSSKLTLSPNCECSYPYMGILIFISPSFSYLDNKTFTSLEKNITNMFLELNFPVDSTKLLVDSDNSWIMIMSIFPSQKTSFSEANIMGMAYILSNQLYKPPENFGPYKFLGQPYDSFSDRRATPKTSSSLSAIIGGAVGGSVLVLVSIGLLMFIMKRRKNTRPQENSRSIASHHSQNRSSSAPQLKGARVFTFDEIKKCTNNFSDDNDIGTGGYGKVYRGTLDNRQLVAVKRAQEGSSQGVNEFTTEIELLSRVHHKNLVSLIGFCQEKGEQMLVYEYVPNGTLKDSLSGKSGVHLDWKRRLCVAIGAAKGIAYLHELANPPIIHRDIKSSNVLLDENLNVKVSDFGLSKSLGNNRKGYVTTQVKGTLGYLDPEYYMTQQLTEKSDVYSFGVLLLEIITGKKPIERGRYIVREVNTLLDRSKDLYNLKILLDPSLSLTNSIGGIKRYIDLAILCVNENGMDRPRMSKVVNEIEKIMIEAGMNPNADSEPNSSSLIGSSYTPRHPYSGEFDDHSGVGLYSRPEPK